MDLTYSKFSTYVVFFGILQILCELSLTHAKHRRYENLDIKENDVQISTTFTRQYSPYYGMGPGGGCPLCDSSVYSYCDHKIIHDSCCCNFPGLQKPPQCYYYDCALLYAKSCYEHSLIKNCCCDNPYRK